MARRKHPKTHVASVHGARGTGATPTDAKAHAIARIQAAFADDWEYYDTRMIRFPLGHVGVVFRTLDGWNYSVLWASATHGNCTQCARYASQEDADRNLRRHMARIHVFETDDNGMSLLRKDDTEGQADHARYIRFQEAAREYKAQGLPDHDVHRLACEAMWRVA